MRGWRRSWAPSPTPFVHLPHQVVKLLHLLGAQDLSNAVASLLVEGLELRIHLLLQVPHFLRSLSENLADLLDLGIGKIQFFLQAPHRTLRVETAVPAACGPAVVVKGRTPQDGPQKKRQSKIEVNAAVHFIPFVAGS